ncbi:MAG: preprotein translocase subunit YajC [Mycobacteriales bacterium]
MISTATIAAADADTFLAAESNSGTNYLPLLLIAGLFVLTYFMIIRPQSKRRRAMVDMQASLSAGTEVVTIGGLYATVVATDAETVELAIAEGITVTYARGAISKVISPAPESDAADGSTDSEPASGADDAADADQDSAASSADVQPDSKAKATTK